MDAVKVRYTCFQEVSQKVIKVDEVREVTCQSDVYHSLLVSRYSVLFGSSGMLVLGHRSSHMTL